MKLVTLGLDTTRLGLTASCSVAMNETLSLPPWPVKHRLRILNHPAAAFPVNTATVLEDHSEFDCLKLEFRQF